MTTISGAAICKLALCLYTFLLWEYVQCKDYSALRMTQRTIEARWNTFLNRLAVTAGDFNGNWLHIVAFMYAVHLLYTVDAGQAQIDTVQRLSNLLSALNSVQFGWLNLQKESEERCCEVANVPAVWRIFSLIFGISFIHGTNGLISGILYNFHVSSCFWGVLCRWRGPSKCEDNERIATVVNSAGHMLFAALEIARRIKFS